MKLYRTDYGSWINLSLYTRFQVKKLGNIWFVAAIIDKFDDHEIVVPITNDYTTKEEAQKKLDEMFEYG